MAVRWVGFNLLSVTQSILEIYVFPESNPYFSIFTCIKTSKHSLKTCFISSVSLFFRSPAYFCVFVLSPLCLVRLAGAFPTLSCAHFSFNLPGFWIYLLVSSFLSQSLLFSFLFILPFLLLTFAFCYFSHFLGCNNEFPPLGV